MSEYIGESYFDYLAGLPDLVLLMDESHRYRASAGVWAINELKPILSLELTATPYIESKATNQMDDPVVQAKKEAAVKWCRHASTHAQSYNGKRWRYLLIPHNEIAENMTIAALDDRFSFVGFRSSTQPTNGHN